MIIRNAKVYTIDGQFVEKDLIIRDGRIVFGAAPMEGEEIVDAQGAYALPGLVDIRLFYAAAALFFGWNAATVGSAESMPFCLLTAGDLSRLLWVHPKWPGLAWGSVLANAAFLLGGGVLCACLPFWKLSFWRRRL